METFSALLAICAWNSPRSPVNSERKGQWRGALMFSLICALINGWVNNREAGDLRRHRANYDVIAMLVRFGIEFTYILQAHFLGAGVGHDFFPVSVTQPLGTRAPIRRLVGPMLGQRCTCWPNVGPTNVVVGGGWGGVGWGGVVWGEGGGGCYESAYNLWYRYNKTKHNETVFICYGVHCLSVARIQVLYSLRRHCLIGIGICFINLRRSSNHLKFIMGITRPVRLCRLVNRDPRWLSFKWYFMYHPYLTDP